MYINDNWLEESVSIDERNRAEEIDFSDSERQIISSWTKSKNTSCFRVRTKDSSIYLVGDHQYEVMEGRDSAAFEDFLSRLQKMDFIGIDKYNSHGEPVYKLKKAAYDYVDSITEKKE